LPAAQKITANFSIRLSVYDQIKRACLVEPLKPLEASSYDLIKRLFLAAVISIALKKVGRLSAMQKGELLENVKLGAIWALKRLGMRLTLDLWPACLEIEYNMNSRDDDDEDDEEEDDDNEEESRKKTKRIRRRNAHRR
jgi:hypothetical protein